MRGVQWVAIIALIACYGLAMFVMGALVTVGNPWWSLAFIAAFGCMGTLIVREARIILAASDQPAAATARDDDGEG